jgi:hypothetical protein
MTTTMRSYPYSDELGENLTRREIEDTTRESE